MFDEEAKTEEELKKARARLDEFETATASTHRLARLKREEPRHPLLLGKALASTLGSLGIAVGLMAIIATVMSPDLQRSLAQVPLVNILPPLLVVGGMFGLFLAAALHFLAVQRGADSPRLPRDQSQMNRLRSDVMRLDAAKKVAKRLSETPAPNRRVHYPGSS